MSIERPMSYYAKPLVSVIIPTYNRAQLVYRAVESVLAQTFKDYEIIVVDDGSTDTTEELLESAYKGKVLYIKKERNEGLAAARNTGIQVSRGACLAFLDDDDTWHPKKLELQIALLRHKPSLGLVYCGYFQVDGTGRVGGEVKPTKRGKIHDELLCRNYIVGSASAALMAKEVVSRIGYFDEMLPSCEDWDMWIRIAKCYEIDFVDEPLVNCTFHSERMSSRLLNMESATFAVLDKHWPENPQREHTGQQRNKLYSDHCISFAWRYYERGERQSFDRLMYKALEYYHLNTVFIQGNDLQGKEEALFEIFRRYWDNPAHREQSKKRRWSLSRHYLQLAWEYYHRGDMKNYRRCVGKVFQFSYPRVPLRLIIPFFKSFLGKPIAEGIHQARERLMKSSWV
jgi:glycosyltransferase involved in cell wall biosynthesis